MRSVINNQDGLNLEKFILEYHSYCTQLIQVVLDTRTVVTGENKNKTTALTGSWRQLLRRIRVVGITPNVLLSMAVMVGYGVISGDMRFQPILFLPFVIGILAVIPLQKALMNRNQPELLAVLDGKAAATRETLVILRTQILTLPWQIATVSAAVWSIAAPIFGFMVHGTVTNLKFHPMLPGLAIVPLLFCMTLLSMYRITEEHRAALFTGIDLTTIDDFRFMPIRKRVLLAVACSFYCIVLVTATVLYGASTAVDAETFLRTLPFMVLFIVAVICAALAWIFYLSMHRDTLESTANNPDVTCNLTAAYDIQGELGSGGMGVVFRAKHRFIGKDVAIKMLDADAIATVDAVERFQLEAKANSRLQHPNIVSVFDFGILPGGRCYLVMDFIDGKSLSDVIEENGPLPIAEALPIFIGLSDALQCAHDHSVLHRDLKPANVMITSKGVAKLVDFGIAKITDDEAPQLTRTGQIFGTPCYMSPEQCRGTKLTGLSDMYSFGCVMFETLTGEAPFNAESPTQIMYMHMTQPVPPLEVPKGEVPDIIQMIINKTLAKDPADRFINMKELTDALVYAQKEVSGQVAR